MEKVSLITVITSTNSNMLKLLSYCFQRFTYENLEWIIIDDGDTSIKDSVPNDERIKYYHFDKNSIRNLYDSLANSIKEKRKTDRKIKLLIRKPFINIPIGMKRNLATSYASSSYILNFEPYCYYTSDYVQSTVEKLKQNDCISTDEMGHFHTKKYVSVMTKQPDRYIGGLKKFCVPLIAYNIKYWNTQKFNNQDKDSEYDLFFNKRNIVLTNYDKNVIRLYNDSTDLFENAESNGWHFQQLSDDDYEFITTYN